MSNGVFPPTIHLVRQRSLHPFVLLVHALVFTALGKGSLIEFGFTVSGQPFELLVGMFLKMYGPFNGYYLDGNEQQLRQ